MATFQGFGSQMTSDLDIMRCAKLLCDEYGDDADLIAATRADKLLGFGELDGHEAWMPTQRNSVQLVPSTRVLQ